MSDSADGEWWFRCLTQCECGAGGKEDVSEVPDEKERFGMLRSCFWLAARLVPALARAFFLAFEKASRLLPNECSAPKTTRPHGTI